MKKIDLVETENADPNHVNLSRGGYFPRRYITDFFRFIEENEADISVITYDDLPWGDDWDFADFYPEERKAWKAELASGKRDPNKSYVLLQYDVDSFPERTMDLLREPTHALCPANIMIFNKRVNRHQLKSSGKVVYTDYELDENLLRTLCAAGFVVGYHMNAHEQALFDVARALEIFETDLSELSERFSIKYFSPHGGLPAANGRNNRDIPLPKEWQKKLRWVQNRYSPRFDGQFSDGGHHSQLLNPADRDIRDFVRKFRPGRRYRILLHPQYYSNNPVPSARFSGTPWYDELMAQTLSPSESYWQDVRLSGRRRFLGIPVPERGALRERLGLSFKRQQPS